MQFCPKCGTRSQTQARSAPSAAPHFRRPPNPRDSVRACPRSRTGSAAAGSRCAGAHHGLGRQGTPGGRYRSEPGRLRRRRHPREAQHRTWPTAPETPRRSPLQPRADHPPSRQPMPAPQPAAALPRPSRRSTARSPAGSRASRPPHEPAAASATGSSCPNLVATVAHVVEGTLTS
jgi:non-specific serine/threonine protein kinase